MAQGATSSILQVSAEIPQEQLNINLSIMKVSTSLSLPPPCALETKIPWRFAGLNMQCLEEINPEQYYLKGGEEIQQEGNADRCGVGCVATHSTALK